MRTRCGFWALFTATSPTWTRTHEPCMLGPLDLRTQRTGPSVHPELLHKRLEARPQHEWMKPRVQQPISVLTRSASPWGERPLLWEMNTLGPVSTRPGCCCCCQAPRAGLWRPRTQVSPAPDRRGSGHASLLTSDQGHVPWCPGTNRKWHVAAAAEQKMQAAPQGVCLLTM